MNLRSLIPFRGNGNLARPEAGLFRSLHREVDRLFDEFSRGFGASGTPAVANLVPSMNISETDKEIEITAEMPGLERKDVEISLEGNVLTIRGEKKFDEEKKDEKRSHHLVERSYRVFYRMLELPPGIDPSTVQATMSKRILRSRFPSPRMQRSRR